ncbi:hypothetical protein K440DRAFT_642334 [Wilcoxina mikolae CBS 423.85]|nr:hypothetical protein K440DRAFT_642334 [Wilcoxina mikolae CBS 423.85]
MGRTDHFRKSRASSSDDKKLRRPATSTKRQRMRIPSPSPPIAPRRRTILARLKHTVKSTVKTALTALSILPPTAEETEIARYATLVRVSLEEDQDLHKRIEFAAANKLKLELEERNKQLKWLVRRVIQLERELYKDGKLKVWKPTGRRGSGNPTSLGADGRVMMILSLHLTLLACVRRFVVKAFAVLTNYDVMGDFLVKMTLIIGF